MKITRRQLKKIISESLDNEVKDPFSDISNFSSARRGPEVKTFGFGIAEVLLMQALTAFANYVAPEIISYIRDAAIEKGADYGYRLLAYKIFETFLENPEGKISTLKMFSSIESLRVKDEKTLYSLTQEQYEDFKNLVYEEIKIADKPFKVNVEKILQEMSFSKEEL